MREILAVFGGGVIGTGLRLAIDAVLPHADDAFPWSTLVINTVGAFVLALLVARVWDSAASWLRAGLGAGLLGSFTTFSALVVSLVALVAADQWMPALAYLVASVLLGLAAAGLGLRMGRGLARPTPIDLVDE